MKCLILGGARFLEVNLCRSLLAEGNEVHVFDRPHVKPSFAVEKAAMNHALRTTTPSAAGVGRPPRHASSS